MIRHPETFHKFEPAGFDGQFFWDFLLDACPGNIQPMDIDGVLERNGWFLLFETKKPGVPIPFGQVITLNRLLSEPNKYLLFLNGKDPMEIASYRLYRPGESVPQNGEPELNPCCSNDIFKLVEDWFKFANSRFSI